MTLRDAIDRYIAWRRAHGARFDTGAHTLHCFSKHVGGNIDCGSVACADVLSFLSGNGRLRPGRLPSKHLSGQVDVGHQRLRPGEKVGCSRPNGEHLHGPASVPGTQKNNGGSAGPSVWGNSKMRHFFKYISTPLAFVLAFFMFGTPSAPGLTAVEEVADVSVGVGGCAYAYGPGEDERDLPNDDNFDDFMCATAVVAGAWAVRSWYVTGALLLMGGAPGAAGFFASGVIGAYGFVAGLIFCN